MNQGGFGKKEASNINADGSSSQKNDMGSEDSQRNIVEGVIHDNHKKKSKKSSPTKGDSLTELPCTKLEELNKEGN